MDSMKRTALGYVEQYFFKQSLSSSDTCGQLIHTSMFWLKAASDVELANLFNMSLTTVLAASMTAMSDSFSSAMALERVHWPPSLPGSVCCSSSLEGGALLYASARSA
jgi:hypothetical protein